jgi:hypothetical protein
MTRRLASTVFVAAALLSGVAHAAQTAAPPPAAPRAAAAAQQTVDLELVIATDVSGSIDNREAYLQRKGVADAFRSKDVIAAIRNGSLGRIAVVYVDFSSAFYNRVVVDWRVIGDEKSATALADTLIKLPRTFGRGTSLSDAIEFGSRLLDSNSFRGTKRTIDLSGDGPNNGGRPIEEARAEAVAKGITINGLPIIDPDGFDQSAGLDRYFQACVIGGPGAFMQVARGFPDFARAIRRKLVLEISDASPAPHEARLIKAAATPQPRPQIAPARPNRPEYDAGCDGRRVIFPVNPYAR